MGWWSATIMGGDTPLDFEGRFYQELGVEMYPGNSNKKKKLPKKKLEAMQDDLVKQVISLGWNDSIGMQALGAVMMENGAKISDKNKKKIIAAAKEDEWAQDDKERKGYIDAFISAVKSYKGTKPLSLDKETLGDAFAKHSGSGLINKNC